MRCTRRGRVAASSTRSATVRAPRSCAIPIRQSRISAVASASGSARWHGRASVAKRYESAARFAGWRPEQLPREPDGVDDGRGDAAAGQPHRLVVEERHVEARVVRDEDRVAREGEEAADGRRDGRRPPQLVVAQARSARRRRLQPRARVRERLEALRRARARARAPRRSRRAARVPGRRPVVSRSKTTNVACSSSSSSPGARRERDEVAGPAQARVGRAPPRRAASARARRAPRAPSFSTFRAASSAATGPRRSSTSSTSRSAASRRSCIRLDASANICSCPVLTLQRTARPGQQLAHDALGDERGDVRRADAVGSTSTTSAADELDARGDLAHRPEQVDRGHAARLGRPGARRERRVEHVDVDRQVDRPLPHVRERSLDDLANAERRGRRA